MPIPGRAYDIGVDIAMGSGRDDSFEDDGLDHTIICVLERGTNEQVAEWSSKAVDPFEMANVLTLVGTFFNKAQIAIETNAIGGGTNQQLAKLGYPNQYIWRYRDEIVPRYSRKTGWETNRQSKPWLVGFAVHEMINGRVRIKSELLFREMEAFMQKGFKEWGAAAGFHDDRVMAWMIALLTSDDENFEKYYGGLRDRSDAKPVNPARTPEPWEADHGFLKKPKASLAARWD